MKKRTLKCAWQLKCEKLVQTDLLPQPTAPTDLGPEEQFACHASWILDELLQPVVWETGTA
jgi:hypothetical protein